MAAGTEDSTCRKCGKPISRVVGPTFGSVGEPPALWVSTPEGADPLGVAGTNRGGRNTTRGVAALLALPAQGRAVPILGVVPQPRTATTGVRQVRQRTITDRGGQLDSRLH
jgi:hypothetical protein